MINTYNKPHRFTAVDADGQEREVSTSISLRSVLRSLPGSKLTPTTWRSQMPYERREYGRGTSITSTNPWGLYRAARVLCSDGRVRATARISETPDTFFSVPCAVKVRGKTVAGYMTFECISGSSVETDDDPTVAKFIATTYNKNHALLPRGAYREEREDVHQA